MVEIEVSSGEGILNILCDGSLSAFEFKNNSEVATWPDCAGSIGMYLASSLIYDKITLSSEFSKSLNEGNFESSSNYLSKFLQVFKNGVYHISFENEIKEFDIHFIDESTIKVGDAIRYSYYPCAIRNFLFTQNYGKLDRQRIDFYKEKIVNGCKPIVLIYSHFYKWEDNYINDRDINDNTWSDDFVIDGHHKMIAYDELRVSPNYFHITKNLSTKDLDFDLFGKIIDLLNPVEIEHFVLNNFRLKVSDDTESMLYNSIIDNHLIFAEKINYNLLENMASYFESKNPNYSKWASDRFFVLESQIQNGRIINVIELLDSHFEDCKYMWDRKKIDNLDDFRKWKIDFIKKHNDMIISQNKK